MIETPAATSDQQQRLDRLEKELASLLSILDGLREPDTGCVLVLFQQTQTPAGVRIQGQTAGSTLPDEGLLFVVENVARAMRAGGVQKPATRPGRRT